MICVNYTRDDVHHLTIRGHAGYGATGHDIVCAAVSILYETLLDAVDGKYTGEDGAGRAEIYCERDEQTDAAFDFVLRGLTLLSQRYAVKVNRVLRQ